MVKLRNMSAYVTEEKNITIELATRREVYNEFVSEVLDNFSER